MGNWIGPRIEAARAKWDRLQWAQHYVRVAERKHEQAQTFLAQMTGMRDFNGLKKAKVRLTEAEDNLKQRKDALEALEQKNQEAKESRIRAERKAQLAPLVRELIEELE